MLYKWLKYGERSKSMDAFSVYNANRLCYREPFNLIDESRKKKLNKLLEKETMCSV